MFVFTENANFIRFPNPVENPLLEFTLDINILRRGGENNVSLFLLKGTGDFISYSHIDLLLSGYLKSIDYSFEILESFSTWLISSQTPF